MKPIYTIQDADCGVIGVFGNVKAAYKFAAKRQVEIADAHGWSSCDQARDLDKSYAKVCNEIRDTVNYPVDLDYEGQTTITCFELNRTDYTPEYMEDTPYSEEVA